MAAWWHRNKPERYKHLSLWPKDIVTAWLGLKICTAGWLVCYQRFLLVFKCLHRESLFLPHWCVLHAWKKLMILNCLLLLEGGCIWRQQNIILENKKSVLYLHYGKVVSSVGFQYIHNLHEEEYLQECKGNCKAAVPS